MATKDLADFTVTPAWQNMVAATTGTTSATPWSGLASVSAVVQNICPGDTIIHVAGNTASATAPAGTGVQLGRRDSVLVNCGTVWVKGEGRFGSAIKLSVTLV